MFIVCMYVHFLSSDNLQKGTYFQTKVKFNKEKRQ